MENVRGNPKAHWNRNSYLLKPKDCTMKLKVFDRNKEKCDELQFNINPPTRKKSGKLSHIWRNYLRQQ